MNETSNEILGVIGDVSFSFLYVLRPMTNRRREKEMIPVKKCDKKEIRENANIKKIVLDSLEERYFKKKSSE